MEEYLATVEGEQYIMGAVFKSPKEVLTLLSNSNVTEDWFYVPRWRYTYRAMLKLKTRGVPIEPSSVLGAAKAAGEDKYIGAGVFKEAIEACKDVRNVQYYLDIMKDKLARRVLNGLADNIKKDIMLCDTSDEVIGKVKWTLSSDMPELRVKVSVDDKLDALGASYVKAGKTGTTGIPYRWEELNAMTGGIPRGKVIVVGSRPKVGKTMLMCNQMFWLAQKHKMPVGIIELEMQEIELRERFIGDDLDLELFDYRRGKATKKDINAFIKRGKDHKQLPINIYDGNRTIENICMVIRDNAKDIPIWAIDYMQRIKSSRHDPKSDRERYERYSNMVTDVANETGVSIIAVCQLNREAEIDYRGKRILPTAKSLKGSGAFEQDAHQVILLGRALELQGESEWKDDQPTVARVVYNRTGHTGDIDYLFRKSQQKMIEKWEAESDE
jgi:replicative DNA helicase